MSPKKEAQRTGSSPGEVLTEEELAAMKEHIQDQKAAARRSSRGEKVDEESVVLERINEMTEPDRSMALRIHAIIKESAPNLTPRLWYGMPAYSKDGKVVCFFQAALKFKARYATLGFNDAAMLDDGTFWPTSFAITDLTPAAEKQISALVKKAVS